MSYSIKMTDESNTLDLTQVVSQESNNVEEVVNDVEEQAEQQEDEEEVEEEEEEQAEQQEAEDEEEQLEDEQAEQQEDEQAEQQEEDVDVTPDPPVLPERPSLQNQSVSDNLCSLKTLVDVLGKWAGNEIRRRQVEDLLKEGSEVDENLDDIEKVVEVLQLWIGEGGSTFREHNHFKNLDEYTLSSESRILSEEKKIEVLKTLTELVVNVSQRKVDVNNIYSIFL